MTEEKKASKKCSGKKNIMFAYGFIQLGSSFVSAIALAAIAFAFCSVKKESNLFKMTEEKKNSKKCSGKKNLMFAYGFIQLGSSFLSAIALAAIAFGFCSVKKESKLFNKCVAEIIEDGGTNSEAVRYCNGGN